MEYLTGPLIAFVGIAALVICTPGPDTAMTIRNALLGGRAAGLATAAGVSTGLAIWALATWQGSLPCSIASEPLFLAVKYAQRRLPRVARPPNRCAPPSAPGRLFRPSIDRRVAACGHVRPTCRAC